MKEFRAVTVVVMCGLIGLAIWVTGSAMPLWALWFVAEVVCRGEGDAIGKEK